MKYWRGYFTAAIFGVLSWVLIQMGQRYRTLIDMVYPYVTRSVQTFLTAWTGGVDFLVWQLALIFLTVIALAVVVLVLIHRGNLVQWIGWAAAVVSVLFCVNTVLYGLNYYAGPIEDDLRMEMLDYTQSELEEATVFYRDKALALADQVGRAEDGTPDYPEFEALAELTANGYKTLMIDRSYSIYGGDHSPVKELGWSGLYSSMGVSGVTCFLTGEAAVNPRIPVVAQPYAMAREMARRLCVAREEAADFSAFLNCQANKSLEYQYSGYFMAYRSCIAALYTVDEAAANEISAAVTGNLLRDLEEYSDYFTENTDATMVRLSTTVSDAYRNAESPEDAEEEIVYSSLCDYLVNWYIAEYTIQEEEEVRFDPYDETQVDLSGIVGALTEGDGE